MAEQLMAFKAGRAFRREGTNYVDPSPTKGAIILVSGDDGLLHFMWKNRSTDEIEEVRLKIECPISLPYLYDAHTVGFNLVPGRCYLHQSASILW